MSDYFEAEVKDQFWVSAINIIQSCKNYNQLFATRYVLAYLLIYNFLQN